MLALPSFVGAGVSASVLTDHRAFDLEKRQHLFHHGVLKPLPPNMVGLWGTGSIHDVGVDIHAAEAVIERTWAGAGVGAAGVPVAKSESGLAPRGAGMGSGAKGREKVL